MPSLIIPHPQRSRSLLEDEERKASLPAARVTQELADSDWFLPSLLEQLRPVADDGDWFRCRFGEYRDDDELLAVRHYGPTVSVRVSSRAVNGCGEQRCGSADALESRRSGHRHRHYFGIP